MRFVAFTFVALGFAATGALAQLRLDPGDEGLRRPPLRSPNPLDLIFPEHRLWWAADPDDGHPPRLSRGCGAQALQGHVGGPLSALLPVAPGFKRREVCHVCARTMDYVPHRQTVEYDEETRLIQTISCG